MDNYFISPFLYMDLKHPEKAPLLNYANYLRPNICVYYEHSSPVSDLNSDSVE